MHLRIKEKVIMSNNISKTSKTNTHLQEPKETQASHPKQTHVSISFTQCVSIGPGVVLVLAESPSSMVKVAQPYLYQTQRRVWPATSVVYDLLAST